VTMDLSKAKDGSLLAKYVAGALMLVGIVLIGVGVFKFTTWDLFIGCLGLVAIFTTVDANIALDKFAPKRSVPAAEVGK
jgi:hypothetical protein